MKKIKWLILLVFATLLVLYFTYQHEKVRKIQNTSIDLLDKKQIKENALDKKAIIDSVDKKLKIIGLEGEISQEPLTFNEDNTFGARNITYVLHGSYSWSYDFGDESKGEEHSITVFDDGTVQVFRPPVKLELNIPFDQVEIVQKIGPLRKIFQGDFSPSFQQELYKEGVNSIRTQMLTDTNKAKAETTLQEQLSSFLAGIKGVKQVIFEKSR